MTYSSGHISVVIVYLENVISYCSSLLFMLQFIMVSHQLKRFKLTWLFKWNHFEYFISFCILIYEFEVLSYNDINLSTDMFTYSFHAVPWHFSGLLS